MSLLAGPVAASGLSVLREQSASKREQSAGGLAGMQTDARHSRGRALSGCVASGRLAGSLGGQGPHVWRVGCFICGSYPRTLARRKNVPSIQDQIRDPESICYRTMIEGEPKEVERPSG